MGFAGQGFDPRLHDGRLRNLHALLRHEAGGLCSPTVIATALHAARFPRLGPSNQEDQVPVASPALPPSLDEWIDEEAERQAASNPGFDRDFYSYQEWLEQYTAAFGHILDTVGADRPSSRASATATGALAHVEPPSLPNDPTPALQDQLQALHALELVLTRAPSPTDLVSGWLSPPMAGRLAQVGVVTLANLVDYINIHGFRWHRSVSRVGSQLAERLVQWLRPLAETFGTPLKTSSLVPVSHLERERERILATLDDTRVFGLVPLNRLAVPPALDGRRGQFRSPNPNVFGVDNDLDAIRCWLERYQESRETHDAYKRIAQRFYLWCLLERGTALSDITEADIAAHKVFLSAPPANWVSPRFVRESSAEWRPMRGRLDPVSMRHSFVVIATLYGALLDGGYLTANPARAVVPRLKLPPARINNRRAFTGHQWSVLMAELAHGPDTASSRRTRLILELGATTGLRLGELCHARLRDLQRVVIDGEPLWTLDVEGKGDRQRTAVVYDDVKAMIDAHHRDMVTAGTAAPSDSKLRTRSGRPLAREPASFEDMRPLIGAISLRPGKKDARPPLADRYGALDPSALHQTLKRALRRAVATATARGALPNEADAANLLLASTHWLRHFFGNSLSADNVSGIAIKQLMGHASLSTTAIYTNPELQSTVREFRKLQRRGPATSG